MALVAVSGAFSRAGKAALAVSLLRGLPRGQAAAMKSTATEDVFARCPRGTPQVVCDIDVPYRSVKADPAELIARGDTVVVNVPAAQSRAASPAVIAEVKRHRGQGPILLDDVTRPLAEWAPGLAARVKGRGASPAVRA